MIMPRNRKRDTVASLGVLDAALASCVA